MNNPKVTALVPSYNHGKYITQRIESIFNQAYKDFELIVIDDHSNDNSDEIIKLLKQKYSFTYISNPVNSGSPFSAWEKVISLAKGKYIWICESDDYAEPEFLQKAVSVLESHKNSVLFYCNSHVVDENSRIIDHTNSFFYDIWRETHWDKDFTEDGHEELKNFQIRGQCVPNMSSALISRNAFQRSFKAILTKFKLTGDWLFIGYIMKFGDIVFSRDTLSNFRKHEITSRVRTSSARSQAEFILTKYMLFRETDRRIKEFAQIMKNDAYRFIHEKDSFFSILKFMCRISYINTFNFFSLLTLSILYNISYFSKLFKTFKIVRGSSNANKSKG